jgi:hypothetical protein
LGSLPRWLLRWRSWCRCRSSHFSRFPRRWRLWRPKRLRWCSRVDCLCSPRRRHHLRTIVSHQRQRPPLIE